MCALFCCTHVVLMHSLCELEERLSTKLFYSFYEEFYQVFVLMHLRCIL